MLSRTCRDNECRKFQEDANTDFEVMLKLHQLEMRNMLRGKVCGKYDEAN